MSQVMNALKSSHQGYQSNTMTTGYSSAIFSAEKTKSFRWYHSLLLIVPSAVTISLLSHQSYQLQQQNIRQVMSQPALVEQIPAPAEFLPYPKFTELKSTYLIPAQTEQVLAETEDAPSSDNKQTNEATATKTSEPSTSVQKENTPLNLEQLDLSGLSPALAMRVESAIKSGGSASTSSNSRAISLVQNADKFSGHLPEMDFQTHVYASSESKRWIKMNGVEYHEGDMLSDGVMLIEINPQTTLVQFEQQLIEIPALYHWQG
ncbi:general secretion pathway protein GspB [Vibrio sp. Y2-5]|uniref:general secretion pathway protein GspB n=1 Tax=Vibrio sp. Y2-5 TaxID=2743977 RepID=UPI0016608E05|nr:general secretion pathway protein GspB [Vibrio sp. Y2-5]MBD0787421.1 general secretion pathway protein GspB [Vibrio sp. Y2-5]